MTRPEYRSLRQLPTLEAMILHSIRLTMTNIAASKGVPFEPAVGGTVGNKNVGCGILAGG